MAVTEMMMFLSVEIGSRFLRKISVYEITGHRSPYLLTYSMERVLLEKLTGFAANQEILPQFMEPESSLPYSQVPATCVLFSI